MNRIPAELFERYLANPLAVDNEVRRKLKLPEDRYYTVSVWPPELAGRVFVSSLHRSVKEAKISKSDRP